MTKKEKKKLKNNPYTINKETKKKKKKTHQPSREDHENNTQYTIHKHFHNLFEHQKIKR